MGWSRLLFVLDTTTVFILIFVILTQIALPLWFDLPVFWLLTKAGRNKVDRRFGYLVGRVCPPPIEEPKPKASKPVKPTTK